MYRCLMTAIEVIVTHTRLYGKKKGEQMNWLPYLQLLSPQTGSAEVYSSVFSDAFTVAAMAFNTT